MSEVVAADVGVALLTTIRADLARYLEGREPDVVLDATGLGVEQTYRRAARVLRSGTVAATG